jgi:hypothetical protein
MLLAVMVLMNEAGKPERWMWMGFEESTGPSLELPGGTVASDSNRGQAPTLDISPLDPASLEAQTAGETAQSATIQLDQSDRPRLQSEASLNYPSLAQEFWTLIFREMDTSDKKKLFRLNRAILKNQAIAKSERPACLRLTNLLDIRRKQFHARVFDRLTLLPEGSSEKTKLANDLYESESVWKDKILPAYQAVLQETDFTVGQRKQVEQMQSLLDAIVFNEVQDRTSIGWRGDSPAWNRAWERAEDEAISDAIPVTHLQLCSQPDIYRGRQVTVEGWVRSARRKKADGGEVETHPHYELWLRPADTNVSPYCVYSRNLPDGFPELADQFQDLNELVRISGQFFQDSDVR